MRGTIRLVVALAALSGPVATACGSDEAGTGPGQSSSVTVFAASSLAAAFREIGEVLRVQRPDLTITFNFGGSSELVTQIGQGAPADVFASADVDNMRTLTDAGDNGTAPVVFASNTLAIIVEANNPRHVIGVADLASPDLVVVTCSPQVPCGRYATQVFQAAGVTVTPKSLEQSVKAVVTKVTLGEADAGVVYVTDVVAAGDRAAGVEIPADINVVAAYPIAVTKQAADPAAAQAFIDFVLSSQGQQILASYGFRAP